MQKVTTLILILCLLLSGAFCYASGAAGMENEKGEKIDIEVKEKTCHGGSDRGACVTNSGAPHELTKMVLSKMPLTACESGNGYYTDVEELGISFYETEDFYGNLNDDFIYDENSPCGYKLYIRNQYNTNHCICPEDMNYYLNKGPELIEYFVPEGRCFISANYESDEIVGVKGRGNCFHRLIIKFGILHCAGPEE